MCDFRIYGRCDRKSCTVLPTLITGFEIGLIVLWMPYVREDCIGRISEVIWDILAWIGEVGGERGG